MVYHVTAELTDKKQELGVGPRFSPKSEAFMMYPHPDQFLLLYLLVDRPVNNDYTTHQQRPTYAYMFSKRSCLVAPHTLHTAVV